MSRPRQPGRWGAALVKLAGRLPPRLLVAIGRVQFLSPTLHRLIFRASRPLRESEGVIRHGLAAGLRFNPAGAHPGYALGTSEPEIQELLAEHLKPGDTFFDIGANVGFFTVLAAKLVGTAGCVVAFEPGPETAEALERNVRANGFDTVQIARVAVGNETGEAAFTLPETGHWSAARLTQFDGPAPYGERTCMVRVVSLDEARRRCEVPKQPQVVKIDVEGAEVAALHGMRDTLRSTRPVVICETHGTAPDVTELLEHLGYAVETLQDFSDEAWNPHVLGLPQVPNSERTARR